VLDPGAGIARPPGRIALGVAPDGTATVAWSQVVGRPVTSYPVRVATSNTSGVFGAAADLAPSGAVHDVEVGPAGTALVVWGMLLDNPDQADQIVAAVRAGGATTFGAAEVVSEPDDPSIAVAAFDPVTGSPAIAWTARKATVTRPSVGVRLSTRPAIQPLSARSSHALCRDRT
jgi:hypothetical protein